MKVLAELGSGEDLFHSLDAAVFLLFSHIIERQRGSC